MAKQQGQTARHRKLAAELLRLRKQSGVSAEDAAAALGWQRSKLSRIESSTTMPTVADVTKLLGVYGGTDHATRLALLELTRQIRERGWWVPYGEILPGSYAELEDAADRILTLQKEGVPGLLQTADYARELIRRYTDTDVDQADARLQARLTRQTILARERAPKLDVLLAEEVLTRPIGDPGVMRGQLQALLAASARPNIRIRVIPFDSGPYLTYGAGSMVVFEFDSPIDLDTVYVETIAGGHYIEDAEQVQRCRLAYAQVAEAALSAEDSASLLETKLKE